MPCGRIAAIPLPCLSIPILVLPCLRIAHPICAEAFLRYSSTLPSHCSSNPCQYSANRIESTASPCSALGLLPVAIPWHILTPQISAAASHRISSPLLSSRFHFLSWRVRSLPLLLYHRFAPHPRLTAMLCYASAAQFTAFALPSLHFSTSSYQFLAISKLCVQVPSVFKPFFAISSRVLSSLGYSFSLRTRLCQSNAFRRSAVPTQSFAFPKHCLAVQFPSDGQQI